MAKRISKKTTIVSGKQNRVVSQTGKLSDVGGVLFSYKYLELEHVKFCVNDQNTEYFIKLIMRLADVSRMTINELKQRNSTGLKSHAIKWKDVSENCFGIPHEDEIVTEPWQFAISANEYGRVHGFIIGNTFFVRWIDPNHLLYASHS